jgi:hypothetical protein
MKLKAFEKRCIIILKIACYISAGMGIYDMATNNINLSIASYCIAMLIQGFILEVKMREKENK